MNNWDELERAAKDCKGLIARYGVSNFADHATPDVVLTLIEQNRELLGALKGLVDSFVDLANSGDAGFFDADEQADVVAARAAIRKATGEEA